MILTIQFSTGRIIELTLEELREIMAMKEVVSVPSIPTVQLIPCAPTIFPREVDK